MSNKENSVKDLFVNAVELADFEKGIPNKETKRYMHKYTATVTTVDNEERKVVFQLSAYVYPAEKDKEVIRLAKLRTKYDSILTSTADRIVNGSNGTIGIETGLIISESIVGTFESWLATNGGKK